MLSFQGYVNETSISRLVLQFFLVRVVPGSSFSGKDTVVKWWDLDTQHCFKTMVGHRTEVRVDPGPRGGRARPGKGWFPLWSLHGCRNRRETEVDVVEGVPAIRADPGIY